MGRTMRTAGVLAALAVVATVVQTAVTHRHQAGPGGPSSSATGSATASPRAAGCERGRQVDGALVTKVTDGDTIHAEACGADITVRIIGLNTPETKKPRSPVECYGPEASRYATQQLFSRRVTLIPDRRAGYSDKYRRWLYRVDVAGQDYAEGAIRAGYGRANDYGHKGDKSAVYAAAEKIAQDAGVGLWGSCPVPG